MSSRDKLIKEKETRILKMREDGNVLWVAELFNLYIKKLEGALRKNFTGRNISEVIDNSIQILFLNIIQNKWEVRKINGSLWSSLFIGACKIRNRLVIEEHENKTYDPNSIDWGNKSNDYSQRIYKLCELNPVAPRSSEQKKLISCVTKVLKGLPPLEQKVAWEDMNSPGGRVEDSSALAAQLRTTVGSIYTCRSKYVRKFKEDVDLKDRVCKCKPLEKKHEG